MKKLAIKDRLQQEYDYLRKTQSARQARETLVKRYEFECLLFISEVCCD
jgi:hypothetical protein